MNQETKSVHEIKKLPDAKSGIMVNENSIQMESVVGDLSNHPPYLSDEAWEQEASWLEKMLTFMYLRWFDF